MKKVLVVVMVLALCLLAFGCQGGSPASVDQPKQESTPPPTANTPPPSQEATVIKIGVLAPLSGGLSSQGQLLKMGIDGYYEYWTQGGGFKNWPNTTIELVFADNESTADVGVTQFEKLINVDKVIAVIGCYASALSAPCTTLANKNEVVFSLVNSVSDSCTIEPGQYVFRGNAGDPQEFMYQKDFLSKLSDISPIKTIALVGNADDYGASAKAMYNKIAEELGWEVVIDETIQAGASDLSGAINKVKQLNPDLVIVASQVNEAILFQRQMKEYQVNVPIFAKGAGYLDSTFIPSVGEACEYVISSALWMVDTLNYLDEEAQKWGAYLTELGGMPPNETTVNAWMSLGIVLDALDRCPELTRKALSVAMAATDLDADHPANLFCRHSRISYADGKSPMSGKDAYNNNWDAVLQFGQILDGKWRTVYPASIVGEYGSETNAMVWPPPAWNER